MNVKQQRDIFMAKRAEQKRIAKWYLIKATQLNSLAWDIKQLGNAAKYATICLGEFSSNIITNKKES